MTSVASSRWNFFTLTQRKRYYETKDVLHINGKCIQASDWLQHHCADPLDGLRQNRHHWFHYRTKEVGQQSSATETRTLTAMSDWQTPQALTPALPSCSYWVRKRCWCTTAQVLSKEGLVFSYWYSKDRDNINVFTKRNCNYWKMSFGYRTKEFRSNIARMIQCLTTI